MVVVVQLKVGDQVAKVTTVLDGTRYQVMVQTGALQPTIGGRIQITADPVGGMPTTQYIVAYIQDHIPEISVLLVGTRLQQPALRLGRRTIQGHIGLRGAFRQAEMYMTMCIRADSPI